MGERTTVLDDPVIRRLADRLELSYSCKAAGAILYPGVSEKTATAYVRRDIAAGELQPIPGQRGIYTISGPHLWAKLTAGLR
jgi:hypothetical protein